MHCIDQCMVHHDEACCSSDGCHATRGAQPLTHSEALSQTFVDLQPSAQLKFWPQLGVVSQRGVTPDQTCLIFALVTEFLQSDTVILPCASVLQRLPIWQRLLL